MLKMHFDYCHRHPLLSPCHSCRCSPNPLHTSSFPILLSFVFLFIFGDALGLPRVFCTLGFVQWFLQSSGMPLFQFPLNLCLFMLLAHIVCIAHLLCIVLRSINCPVVCFSLDSLVRVAFEVSFYRAFIKSLFDLLLLLSLVNSLPCFFYLFIFLQEDDILSNCLPSKPSIYP